MFGKTQERFNSEDLIKGRELLLKTLSESRSGAFVSRDSAVLRDTPAVFIVNGEGVFNIKRPTVNIEDVAEESDYTYSFMLEGPLYEINEPHKVVSAKEAYKDLNKLNKARCKRAKALK